MRQGRNCPNSLHWAIIAKTKVKRSKKVQILIFGSHQYRMRTVVMHTRETVRKSLLSGDRQDKHFFRIFFSVELFRIILREMLEKFTFLAIQSTEIRGLIWFGCLFHSLVEFTETSSSSETLGVDSGLRNKLWKLQKLDVFRKHYPRKSLARQLCSPLFWVVKDEYAVLLIFLCFWTIVFVFLTRTNVNVNDKWKLLTIFH